MQRRPALGVCHVRIRPCAPAAFPLRVVRAWCGVTRPGVVMAASRRDPARATIGVPPLRFCTHASAPVCSTRIKPALQSMDTGSFFKCWALQASSPAPYPSTLISRGGAMEERVGRGSRALAGEEGEKRASSGRGCRVHRGSAPGPRCLSITLYATSQHPAICH